MATLQRRWIISILLTNIGFAASEPPAPPSHPGCVRECDKNRCSENIHCSWNPGPDPQTSTQYNLHWEYGPDPHIPISYNLQPRNYGQGNVTSPNRSSAVIPRKDFLNDGDLRVWVEVKNEHGTVRSQESVFNTAEIKKPPPPDIAVRQQEPLEIEWQSGICGDLGLSMGTCEVRHKIKGTTVWLEHESGFTHAYTLESPLPGTAYEFQVRCNCSTSLISDWSKSLWTKSAERAPVGELDLWRDCGFSSPSSDCTLTWKTLPISQANGVILGYDVTLLYNNMTSTRLNVSTAEPGRRLRCDDLQCHLNSSLKDVSSASVAAFNSRGSTTASNLTMPTAATGEDGMTIYLRMNEENLSVWWDPPSQSTPKEYVVQYKQVGSPPGHAFDWIKVAGSQKSVFFKGQFKKYTAFQVSLFAISHHRGEVRYLSSTYGYSHEGIPSSVPLFMASAIADTQVTLFWKTVPLSKQNGVILYYQVGIDGSRVYNVSVAPRSKNGTLKLTDLSPGQKYKVWVRAVTKAGPGGVTSITFITTEQHYHTDKLTSTLVPLLCLIVFCAVYFCLSCIFGPRSKVCPLSLFTAKVPDPRNSRICREMKHLINEPLTLPVNEPHPHISVLEVVTIQRDALNTTSRATAKPGESTAPVVNVGRSQRESQEEQRGDSPAERSGRPGHGIGRKEYSQMVDSDEERDREDDCWSSLEEEQVTSGYERHFMPSVSEILEV